MLLKSQTDPKLQSSGYVSAVVKVIQLIHASTSEIIVFIEKFTRKRCQSTPIVPQLDILIAESRRYGP